MLTIVGVRFKKAGKIYYFLPEQLELSVGDGVIVETARGVEYGTVVIGPKEVFEDTVVAPVKPVIRKATPKDLKQIEKNKEREEKAFDICLEKIEKRKLPMKLINVEYTFDMNKIIFFFTADGRIDFRELVKDLATVFRTRIELRQVGVRDEAKVLNGIGACGRPLCCSNYLGDFTPVSIRMAKDQNLSLNPTKISGVCGRLMCCLNYEDDLYKKGGDLYVKKERPQAPQDVAPPGIGKEVVTDEGIGKVLKVNHHKHTVKVQLEAIALIHFCLFNGRHTYVDLGTGTGVMPLIGTSLGAGHITGIDINKIIIEMAQRSVEHNHKQDVVTMLCGDYRHMSYRDVQDKPFDGVIVNPPFYDYESGAKPTSDERAVALHDKHTSLQEVLKAVQSFIKCKGRLWMIYSASRLQYVLYELEIANFQAKRIRFIHGMIDKPAKLVLIEALYQGQAGLVLEPPLIVYEKPNVYTKEVSSWYER